MSYFNSIKVRLERDEKASHLQIVSTNFNSIKVRLELASDLFKPNFFTLFQFHKGKIRTLIIYRAIVRGSRFQFHKGTIRTSPPSSPLPTPSEFQFHKGTIRTYLLLLWCLHHPYFNSIKVRLEHIVFEAACDKLVNFNSIKVRLELSLPPKL